MFVEGFDEQTTDGQGDYILTSDSICDLAGNCSVGTAGSREEPIQVRIPPPVLIESAPPIDGLPQFVDDLRFKIPTRHFSEVFQITFTQGPIAFVTSPVFFYHPIFEAAMYEMPALGADMYQFIDNNISPTNPALMPGLFPQDEEKKDKKV